MEDREYFPGDIVALAGRYIQLNVFGSPTGTHIDVGAGEALPPSPIGFRWQFTDETAD